MVLYGMEARTELRDLSSPVFEQGAGRYHKRSRRARCRSVVAYRADDLERLAEPHFIGQQAACLFGDDETKPLPPADLVGVERCVYPLWYGSTVNGRKTEQGVVADPVKDGFPVRRRPTESQALVERSQIGRMGVETQVAEEGDDGVRVGGGYWVPSAFMNNVPVTDCLGREREGLIELCAGFEAYGGTCVVGEVHHEYRIYRIR